MPLKLASRKSPFVELEPVIPGFMYRGQITLIAGPPYAGKSTGTLKKIAVPLASGTLDLLGSQRSPMHVLYCSERDWAFNSAQLKSVGITELPDNLRFFCIPEVPTADLNAFNVDPLKYIASLKEFKDIPPDAVILDTAPHFQHNVIAKDANNYNVTRREMMDLKRWATDHNMSVLAEYHSPKQNAKTLYEDPFDKILGSTATLAASTAAAIMERINDEYLRIHFRSHLTKLQTPRFFRYGDFEEVDQGIAENKAESDAVTNAMILGSKLSARESDYLLLVPPRPTPFQVLNSQIAETWSTTENNGRNIAGRLLQKGFVKIETDPTNGTKVIYRVQPS